MKSIFTYPSNPGDHYIDPDYLGDDTEGFQKRIKDLKDGNYKTWAGTAPTQSVDAIMEALSKFNNNSALEEDSGNNTIYKFWEEPVLTGTTELIESDISSATAVDGVTSNVEFSGDHGFYQEQKMLLSDFNNSWSGLNGNEYYVKKIDADTIQLAVDSGLTQLIEFYDLLDPEISDATAQHLTVADFNFGSAHGFTEGMQVIPNSFDGSFPLINGNNYYVKVINSTKVQLATDSGLINLLKFYNGANGYLTAASPKKYSSDAGLTLSPNVGDINTLSDGDVISFNNLTPDPNSWSSSLTGPLYAGNVSGTNFRVYTDLARTIESAPYHNASSISCTAVISGDVVITHPVTPSGINTDFVDGMPIDISGFDGTIGTFFNGQTLYVKNYNSGARTMNVTTDSAGSNIVSYAPEENDVDIDTVKLHSNNDMSIKIPERATKVPNATRMVIEQDPTSAPTSGETAGATSEVSATNAKGSRWVNSTRFATLFATSLEFYDYTKSTRTITIDSPASITLTDAEYFVTNPSWSTIVVFDYTSIGSVTLADKIHIITDSGSGYTTDTVNLTSEIPTFEGFRTNTGVRISDDGLTLVIGDPEYDGPGPDTLIGKFYIFERASLSVDFDFANPDFTDTGDVQSHLLGNDMILSGDGDVLLAGPKDQSSGASGMIDKIYVKSGSTWSQDTTNTIPAQASGDRTCTGGATVCGQFNSTGTMFIGYSSTSGNHDTLIYTRSSTSTAFTLSQTFGYSTGDGTNTWQFTPDQNYLIATSTSGTTVGTLQKLSGSTFSSVTAQFISTLGGTRIYIGIPGPGGDETNVMVEETNTGLYYWQSIPYGGFTKIRVLDLTLDDTELHGFLYGNNSPADWDHTLSPLTYYLEYTATAGGKDEYLLYTDESLTTKVSGAALDGFSAGDYTMSTYYEMSLNPNFTDSTTGNIDENYTATGITPVTSYVTPTFSSSNNTFTESYTPAGPWELFFAGSLTDATTGELVEDHTPATPNIIPIKTLSGATAGTLTIETSESNRYRLASVTPTLFGNLTYLQRTGASTYVNNAELKQELFEAGATDHNTSFAYFPVTTVSTDSNGRVSAFSYDTEFPGALGINGDKMFTPQTVADTYTPPAPTPIEIADTWDTDDEWTSDAGTTPDKEWPTHITPMSAEIVYNSPTIVNSSQSGVKYTRSAGHTKWRLDVTYPPMSAENFQKFHAIAQAAHGQSTPFHFRLQNKDGTSILWKDFYDQSNSTTSPRIKDAITAGDTTMLVEGFNSNESTVFVQGEVFIDGENENGYLHTALSGTDANVFGEAKIRTPWPFRTANAAGEKIYKNPSSAVVTLASDDFEYQVDVNNYYYVSVSFDLDSWK